MSFLHMDGQSIPPVMQHRKLSLLKSLHLVNNERSKDVVDHDSLKLSSHSARLDQPLPRHPLDHLTPRSSTEAIQMAVAILAVFSPGCFD